MSGWQLPSRKKVVGGKEAQAVSVCALAPGLLHFSVPGLALGRTEAGGCRQPASDPSASRSPRWKPNPKVLRFPASPILEGFSCREGAPSTNQLLRVEKQRDGERLHYVPIPRPGLSGPSLPLAVLWVKQGAGPSLLSPGRDTCPQVQVWLYPKHGDDREDTSMGGHPGIQFPGLLRLTLLLTYQCGTRCLGLDACPARTAQSPCTQTPTFSSGLARTPWSSG
ncbi:uncharacterized protein LOC123812961 [Phyllostomus hastatus]|uniref:uncharacterized protein LOC123812961 n=1 Tax=Phyllostomus hastatus TaxID=9423 RepID=UPI001E67F531|nr:uncharacterized protein LOC123812961 [Phyllostomus hastatus]